MALFAWLSSLFPWLFRRSEPAAPPAVIPGPDSHLPTAPDVGQHDVWKRQMRLDLWRFLNGVADPGVIDLRDVGLRSPTKGAHECRDYYGALLPLSPDICAASKRIGFRRLCMATGLIETPVSFDSEAHMLGLYNLHLEAARREADRMYRLNTETAKNWPAARGPFVYDSVEITLSILSPGPFDGPEHYDPATLAPLIPLKAQE